MRVRSETSSNFGVLSSEAIFETTSETNTSLPDRRFQSNKPSLKVLENGNRSMVCSFLFLKEIAGIKAILEFNYHIISQAYQRLVGY